MERELFEFRGQPPLIILAALRNYHPASVINALSEERLLVSYFWISTFSFSRSVVDVKVNSIVLLAYPNFRPNISPRQFT